MKDRVKDLTALESNLVQKIYCYWKHFTKKKVNLPLRRSHSQITVVEEVKVTIILEKVKRMKSY